ncbi:MAG: hypothetical protein KGI34_01080 [Bradyrhizobium sp.]|nr:hypothetical protein [Bradyrhizobium sp.]
MRYDLADVELSVIELHLPRDRHDRNPTGNRRAAGTCRQKSAARRHKCDRIVRGERLPSLPF